MEKTGPTLRPISAKKDHAGFMHMDYKIIDIDCPNCSDHFWFAKLSLAEEGEIENQRIGFMNHLSETCPNHTDEVWWDDIK